MNRQWFSFIIKRVYTVPDKLNYWIIFFLSCDSFIQYIKFESTTELTELNSWFCSIACDCELWFWTFKEEKVEPVNPGWQVHTYPIPTSSQVPWFWQGFRKQSWNIWDREQNLLNQNCMTILLQPLEGAVMPEVRSYFPLNISSYIWFLYVYVIGDIADETSILFVHVPLMTWGL